MPIIKKNKQSFKQIRDTFLIKCIEAEIFNKLITV